MRATGHAGGTAVGLIVFLLVAAGMAGAVHAESPTRVPLIDPSSGGNVSLDGGNGLLHVVVFATWCGECVAELEELSELEDRWKSSGYRLVLAAVRSRQDVERLDAFIKQREHLPGQLLFDAEGRLEKALGVQGVPLHVLFDAAGAELARAETAAEIAPRIPALLGKSGRPR